MSTRSNDRSSLCAFTSSDGRRCRIPREDHPRLCADHARKEAQALAGQKAGEDIAFYLSATYPSACDLTIALGRLFSAVAQGQVKPRTAATLAYLGQTMVQTLNLAQHEYINAFGTDTWRKTIANSHKQTSNYMNPPKPKPPQSAPVSASAPAPVPPAAAASAAAPEHK
jgi:hypothetical protein